MIGHPGSACLGLGSPFPAQLEGAASLSGLLCPPQPCRSSTGVPFERSLWLDLVQPRRGGSVRLWGGPPAFPLSGEYGISQVPLLPRLLLSCPLPVKGRHFSFSDPP